MRLFFFIWIIFLSFSCQDTVQIKDFDTTLWQKDRLACQNKRKDMINSLEAQKAQLKGMTRVNILYFLGRPDKQELYQRNQRFYIYHYEKGTQCKGKGDIQSKILKIRFSAIDLVTEVQILK
jgi:outer membrane protein assembly factor BamE (lipoprotein component of BamABCDE complex)